MELFKKLPGFQRTPAGVERKILRSIPWVLTLGLGVLLLPSVFVRLTGRSDWAFGRLASMVDIYAMGAILFFCNIVAVVGFAALIVMLMKGPAYVADAYNMEDSEFPRKLDEDDAPFHANNDMSRP